MDGVLCFMQHMGWQQVPGGVIPMQHATCACCAVLCCAVLCCAVQAEERMLAKDENKEYLPIGVWVERALWGCALKLVAACCSSEGARTLPSQGTRMCACLRVSLSVP